MKPLSLYLTLPFLFTPIIALPQANTPSPAPIPWHVPYQELVLPARALARHLDLLHGLANLVPFASPGLKTVVTLLDITWLHYPEALPDRFRGALAKRLWLASARRADRVLALHDGVLASVD